MIVQGEFMMLEKDDHIARYRISDELKELFLMHDRGAAPADLVRAYMRLAATQKD